MPAYTESLPHTGSGEQLFLGLYDEPSGTLARTIPRPQLQVATVAVGTTGTVSMHGIPLAAGMVVGNLAVLSGTTAASGPTHWWLALADMQLNVLAVTADQLSAAIAASTFLKVATTATLVVPYTGLFYFVVSFSTSVTQPTLTGNAAIAGVNSSPVLRGTAGTSATPPALGSQINSGTVSASGQPSFGAWVMT